MKSIENLSKPRHKCNVSVDPGVNKCGVAEWSGGVLERVHLLDDKEFQRVRIILPGDVLCIEYPQIYPAARMKGDPNDLIDVAYVVGRWSRLFGAVFHPRPRDWKGTIDADIMTQRILSRLTPSELEIVLRSKTPRAKTVDHNVVDAVGIGLWAWGRL